MAIRAPNISNFQGQVVINFFDVRVEFDTLFQKKIYAKIVGSFLRILSAYEYFAAIKEPNNFSENICINSLNYKFNAIDIIGNPGQSGAHPFREVSRWPRTPSLEKILLLLYHPSPIGKGGLKFFRGRGYEATWRPP